jgi:hypothetical protein
MTGFTGAARHRGDPNFFVQLGDERATTPADICALYRQLCDASSDAEEFELLNAAFNRVCQSNPEAVAIALRMEAFAA